jgi:NAD(P)-dependent dehydrogenase (short-subunit alcohol dehydrogenase family)
VWSPKSRRRAALAIANGASVTDEAQVRRWSPRPKERWGGVHILINNAGILRDKSFAKMSIEISARWWTST